MYHILLLFFIAILYCVHNTLHSCHRICRRPEECGLAVTPRLRHQTRSCVRVRNIITRLINRYDFKVPKSLLLKHVPNITKIHILCTLFFINIEKIIIYMKLNFYNYFLWKLFKKLMIKIQMVHERRRKLIYVK